MLSKNISEVGRAKTQSDCLLELNDQRELPN